MKVCEGRGVVIAAEWTIAARFGALMCGRAERCGLQKFDSGGSLADNY